MASNQGNTLLQQALLERARREQARRQQSQRTLGETLYENIVGRGEIDTPGERAGSVLKAARAGMMRGAASLPGLPADLAQLGIAGMERIGALPPADQRRQGYLERALPYINSEAMRGYLASVPFLESEYRDPTLAGQYGATTGEFIGGGAGGRIKPMVAAGVASETAGQMTAGSEMEPYARMAAGMAGPSLARAGSSAVRSAISPYGGANPRRIELANVLEKYGVPVTAGQRVGAPSLQRAEGDFMELPQREAFTREVMRTIGEDATYVTPSVLQGASKRIGDVFETATQGVDVAPSLNTLARMNNAIQSFKTLKPAASAPPIFEEVNKRLIDAANTGTPIPADVLASWRSNFSKLTRSNDAEIRDTAIDAVELLDDEIASALSAAGRADDLAALQQARAQWRNFKAIEQSLSGKGGAGGLVSPAQLRAAVVSQNRGQFLRGQRGDLGELAAAGDIVMTPPPAAPAGGVRTIQGAGRLVTAAGGGGAAMAAGADPLSTLLAAGAGAALPSAYEAFIRSRGGQSYMANQLLGPAPPVTLSDVMRTIPGGLLQVE